MLGKEITSDVDLDHRRMKFALGVIYQPDPDAAARIHAMLKEIVEANGGTFIRSGVIGFGPSSLDFELEFDVFDPDLEKGYQARHQNGLGIQKKFTKAGMEFADRQKRGAG